MSLTSRLVRIFRRPGVLAALDRALGPTRYPLTDAWLVNTRDAARRDAQELDRRDPRSLHGLGWHPGTVERLCEEVMRLRGEVDELRRRGST